MWVIEICVSIYDEKGPSWGHCLFHSDQIVAKVKSRTMAKVIATDYLTKFYEQETEANAPTDQFGWEHEDECDGEQGESCLLEFNRKGCLSLGGPNRLEDGITTREYTLVIYKEVA